MFKIFGIPALVLGSLMALVPQTASARYHDYDRDRRAWDRQEGREWRAHERWERRHHYYGYRYGFYGRYRSWHWY